MSQMPDEEGVYLAYGAKNKNKQSYNNFERILFLLVLFIITALALAISLPLFVLAQARALLLPKKNRQNPQLPEKESFM